jgi:hypothetical protein
MIRFYEEGLELQVFQRRPYVAPVGAPDFAHKMEGMTWLFRVVGPPRDREDFPPEGQGHHVHAYYGYFATEQQARSYGEKLCVEWGMACWVKGDSA